MYLENLRFVELSNCSSPGLQWMWVRGRIAGPGLPVRIDDFASCENVAEDSSNGVWWNAPHTQV